jgi:hypothetical protein
MEAPSYETRLVAFVDILGFSAIVERLDKNPSLHEKLYTALTHIGTYKKNAVVHGEKKRELEVSVFSDSIVMSGDPNSMGYLIWNCGWLQAQLLGLGILTRGGISIGRLIHSNDILYGDGMLNAYRIESSASVYPRIVIDPCLIDKISEKVLTFLLERDADGLWFIDPYAFDATVGNVEALAEDAYDPHDVYLEEVSGHIRDGIKNAKRVDHFAKWSWLKKRHDEALNAYTKTRKTKLDMLKA